MKISADLRATIRAAERAQPSTERRKADATAIAELLKARPGLQGIVAKSKKHYALYSEQVKLLEKVGFNSRLEWIDNEDLFRRAGGKLPTIRGKWSADTVIARLAGAEPKDEQKILKEYGIRWE